MFSLNTLVQKAQSFIDPALSPGSPSADKKPSKATLFRHQFRLPDSQNPICEIPAELTLSASQSSADLKSRYAEKEGEHTEGITYAGKLHLSESYICFSTQATSFQPTASVQVSTAFTGQTHGTGPAGNGFIIPLCAIRDVERLRTQNTFYTLGIVTWNGYTVPSGEPNRYVQRFTLRLIGSRQACDRFCDSLKKGLRSGLKQLDNLKLVVAECYSEYLLAYKAKDNNDKEARRDPPDAGLGMLFKHPGDARKLRDGSKMRLWSEYFRGWLSVAIILARLKLS